MSAARVISIRLSKQLERELRAHVKSAGAVMSEFVREAITEKISRSVAGQKTPYELGQHYFGKYRSGRSDVSERADELVAEAILKRHRRRRGGSI